MNINRVKDANDAGISTLADLAAQEPHARRRRSGRRNVSAAAERFETYDQYVAKHKTERERRHTNAAQI